MSMRHIGEWPLNCKQSACRHTCLQGKTASRRSIVRRLIRGKFSLIRDIQMATPAIGKSTSSNNELEPGLRTILLAQKSELLGELAQAMGNRFNNIMMAVSSYAELELKKTNGKEKRSLEQLLDHATRATFLIHKLLNFTRAGATAPQTVDINSELREVEGLLRELLGENVTLDLDLGTEVGVIRIDCAELEQMLFALVVGARRAIMRDGRVLISTSLVNLDHEFMGSDRAEPGRYLALRIQSSGREGNFSADQSELDSGETSCLSLVAVRQIVEGCHGLARITINPGVEASFSLYFPELSHVAVRAHDPQPHRNPAIPRTILLVEDDDAVRIPAAEFLMMEGFKVLQAKTGKEALNVTLRSRSSLDLLVTDIFMPEMTGHEVANELSAQNQDLKVLYISGDPDRSLAAGVADSATLRKPFRLNVLRDKIHDLLGE
jgi:two-component system, cell cycle sensor histidine kinase and response regulator CckA